MKEINTIKSCIQLENILSSKFNWLISHLIFTECSETNYLSFL